MKIEQDKLELAARIFFSEQAKDLTTGKILTEKLPEVKLYKQYSSQENENSKLYMYLNSNGKGWVVLSADNSLRPVYAYTEDDTSEMSDCPPFDDMMNDYVSEANYIFERREAASGKNDEESLNLLKSITANDKEWEKMFAGEITLNSYDIDSENSNNKYMITSSWKQDGCYNGAVNHYCNNKNPITTNQYAVGCVGVALGQIIRYWGCNRGLGNNLKFKGKVSYIWKKQNVDNEMSVDFGTGKTIAFNHLPTTLLWGSSDEDKQATVNFLCDVALMLKSNFGLSTSARSSFACDVIKNNTNSPCDVCKYIEEDEKDEKGNPVFWKIIRRDIESQMPVLFRGSSNKDGGGHAMILDGYQSKYDNYHFNMGWGNGSNFWGKAREKEFSKNLGAVTGIRF